MKMELPLEEVTIAEVLKSAGSATWHVGKWHLGDVGFYPQNQGFDVNIAGHAGGFPDRICGLQSDNGGQGQDKAKSAWKERLFGHR